jgi:SAM-dependent methyltransferase
MDSKSPEFKRGFFLDQEIFVAQVSTLTAEIIFCDITSMFKKREFLNKPHVYTSKFLFWKTLDTLRDLKLENPHFKTALDLPCGGGAVTKYIVEDLKMDCQAADIDPAKYEYSAPFQVCNLNKTLPYSDESFDITVCMEGLKHLTDVNNAVKELSRVTKKGGYAVFSIPNDLCLQNRLSYLFDGLVDIDWKRPDPEHVDIKDHLYLKSLVSLPYLYIQLTTHRLSLASTAASHFRFPSVVLMLIFFPVIVMAVWRHIPFKHPLFKQMVSPTWLTGRRNLIVCKKV